MKFIPILYSTAMVKAKQAGIKTQTRRVITQLPADVHKTYAFSEGDIHYWKQGINGITQFGFRCKYGQPGDVLWTRETHFGGYMLDENDRVPDDAMIQYWYYADQGGARPFDMSDDHCYHLWGDNKECWPRWKPSIRMPKEAARFFDKILSVRVERVASISEEDAIAEGVDYYQDEILGRRYKDYLTNADGYGDPAFDYPTCATAVESYKSLWQKINGTPSPVQKKIDGKLKTVAYTVYPFDEEAAQEFAGKVTWKGLPLTVITNPWVWVIEFEPIEKPESFLK